MIFPESSKCADVSFIYGGDTCWQLFIFFVASFDTVITVVDVDVVFVNIIYNPDSYLTHPSYKLLMVCGVGDNPGLGLIHNPQLCRLDYI